MPHPLRRFTATGQCTAVFLILSCGMPLSAQVTFTQTPNLGSGTVVTDMRGVSGNGSVRCGYDYDSTTTAVKWTDGGGVVGLAPLDATYPSSYSWNVSADGNVIVGQSHNSSGYLQPVYWNSTGIHQITDSSMHSGRARDCSSDGSVIVGAGWFTNQHRAFRWTSSGGLVDLGGLDGATTHSHAMAVSDDGSVVTGYSYSYELGTYRGFHWTSANGMVDIGDYPGTRHMVIPMQISGDGSTIVGYARTSSGNQPFRWTADTGVTPLETWPSSAGSNVAWCTNSDGSIVAGWSDENGVHKATLWLPDSGIQYLDTLLTDAGIDLTGWTLACVTGISADGSTLVGYGTNPSNQPAGWIATLNAPADPILISIPGSLSTNEDTGTLQVTVSIDTTSTEPLSVNYSTSPISATAGSDYVTASGTATIPAGSTTTTIPLGIYNDSLHEGNESFSLTISNPTQGAINADTTLITINDDDPAPPDPDSVIYPGNLDATFASAGTSFEGLTHDGSDLITDMAIDRQGRAIVGGIYYTSESYKPMVMRMLSDGSIDTSFGQNGYATPWEGSAYINEGLFAITLQDDGKILACGRTHTSSNGKLVVARLNADGSVDTSFGTNGTFVYTGNSSSISQANDIIELDNGIIYVVGPHTLSYVQDTIMIALDQTGTPWTSFSGDGVELLFSSDASKVIANTFEVDSEGRFVIAGKLSDDFGVARVNPDGTTDTSFGTNGFTRMGFSPETDYVIDIDIDSAGRIIGGGPYDSISGSTRRYLFGLFRLLEDGTMDTSFHYDGRAHPYLGTSNEEIPQSIEALDSGRILVCGHTVNGFGIIRMHSSGELDTSFGTSGVATIGPTSSGARRMHIGTDGSLLIAGDTSSGNHDLILARLTPNGAADTDWATDGYVQLSLNRMMYYSEWLGLHRDSQGRIYTAGYSNPGYRVAMAARFSADGQLDTSFADSGFDSYRYYVTKHYYAWDITTDSSNNAYVCGTEQNNAYLFIRKLDSNGELDPTFSGDGIHTFRPVTAGYQEVFTDLDASNNIILASSAYVSGTLQVILAKITPTGTYDTSFNTTGYSVSSFSNNHFVKGFLQLPDGKLLICGHVHDGSNYKPFAARFLADGTPDTSFGTDGYAEFTSLTGAYTTEGITIDGEGNLFLTGKVSSYPGRSTPQVFLMKISATGAIDTSFATSGINVTNLSIGADYNISVAGVTTLSDGRILVGASGWASGTDGDMMLLRFHTDGSLDTSFGLNGLAQADPVAGLNYNGYGDKLNTILAIDDDLILGAGAADAANGFFRPALCRFLIKDLSFEDHMTLAGINGADADPEADPNNDGIPNLLSLAFGIDPQTGAGRDTQYPSAALDQDGVSGSLNFSVPTSPPSNLVCIVYESSDLGTWTEIARRVGAGEWTGIATVTTTSSADGMNDLSITCPPESTCGFFRVEVSLSP